MLIALCAYGALLAPSARAESGGLLAFGTFGWPPTDDQFFRAGPVAVDADDGSLFVSDLADDSYPSGSGLGTPRIRKYSSTGERKALVLPTVSNSGADPYINSLALDRTRDRLYALVVADDHGLGMAKEILAFSTTPQCSGGTCTLVAPNDADATTDGVTDGVLIDFRNAGDTAGAVDNAAGIAVDPGTGNVALLGVDDATVSDPHGVIQYVSHGGSRISRLVGLGAGLDPDGTTVGVPGGLAIAPDGNVYVATAPPRGGGMYDGIATAWIYRLPRQATAPASPALVAQDSNTPLVVPGWIDLSGAGFGPTLGSGSPIAVSADGSTVYLTEIPDATNARVRGYDTATGRQTVVYGSGTGLCSVLPNSGGGIAAGAGNYLVQIILDFNNGNPSIPVHIFGDGGTGCPRAHGVLKVNNQDSGTVTVTKGQNVSFDAASSELLGGTPAKVSWDFDNSGAFATEVTSAPFLTNTYKFLQKGTYHVGVKIDISGAPGTEAVYRDVKVEALTPTASFKVSNRTPAAGSSVTFDGSDSLDPTGSSTAGPTHELAKYRWDFGDGSAVQETTGATVAHTFANTTSAAITRTIKLTVVSKDDLTSTAVQQAITVAAGATVKPPDNGGDPTPVPPGGGGNTPPAETKIPNPTVSGQSVDTKGSLTVKVTCPAGATACVGKSGLVTKVKKKVKGKTKTVTVKLGTISFTVDAGKSKNIKFKLSASNSALLKKLKKLTVTATTTVSAGGKSSTKVATFVIKAPATKHK